MNADTTGVCFVITLEPLKVARGPEGTMTIKSPFTSLIKRPCSNIPPPPYLTSSALILFGRVYIPHGLQRANPISPEPRHMSAATPFATHIAQPLHPWTAKRAMAPCFLTF
eukprot:5135439-Amphidinium_carterae.1